MRSAYQGTIIDGRNRLKVCLELGIEPWIDEYSGTLSIAQYILTTNIRRNLSKSQRRQLLADFMPIIIPEIDAEMKERKKSKPGRLVTKDPSSRKRGANPGRLAIMKVTGATDTEAQLLKSIHDKAPELLAEVGQCGLVQTEKKARKRAPAKESKKDNGQTHAQW